MEQIPIVASGRIATPTEEAEAEKLLAAAGQQMLADLDARVGSLKEFMRHREYFEALLEANKITELVFEYARYF